MYWIDYQLIIIETYHMKSKNTKQLEIPYVQKINPDAYLTQNTKIGQSYRSYFFRSPQQKSDCSPCQSTQTNKTQKTKSRVKDTRIRMKNNNEISSQLQSTQKNQIQILRDENTRLKQAIADLKLANLYQINEQKVKDLLIDIENLRQELKIAEREVENLKLQNDFLIRSNIQLKNQIKKLQKYFVEIKTTNIKKSLGKISTIINQGKIINTAEIIREPRQKNYDYCGYMPENYEQAENPQRMKLRSPRNNNSLTKYLNNRRQKSSSLAKIKSQRNFMSNQRIFQQVKEQNNN